MSATGQPVLPRADRIRYEEVAADLKKHYEATGSRDLKEYARRVQHLDRFFTGRRIAAIGQPVVDAYIVRRQEEPKEGPPREGFFERDQYEAVRRLLSADLQAAVAIAYTCGWRMQSEVLTLERRQLDLEAGTLRLEPGTTRNDEGRVDQEGVGGRVRGGQRPGDARHDFRRTAVRNMVNAGVPERVAMKVTGHKTRAVFDRYHIVSPGDLQDVARKLTGTFQGTSGGESLDSRTVSG